MQQNTRTYDQLDAALVEIEEAEREYAMGRALLARGRARQEAELTQATIDQARRVAVSRIDAVVAMKLN